MKIAFPWPSPKVFPNFKRANHWRVYRDVEKSERKTGCILTSAAIPAKDRRELRDRLQDKLVMAVTFIPPDARNRDDDGMIGAFKHLRDGMADALGIDDKHFRCFYGFADPQKPGAVIVEVKPFVARNFEKQSALPAPGAVNGLPPSDGEAA